MKLPPDERNDAAMVIMQLMENSDGGKTGLNGETWTAENIIGFIKAGVPTVLLTLMTTPEGREFLVQYGGLFLKKAYDELGPLKFIGVVSVVVQLAPLALLLAGGVYVVSVFLDTIISFVDSIKELAENLKEYVKTICSEAKVLYESWLIGRKISNPAASYTPGDLISANAGQIRTIADQLSSIQNIIVRLDDRLNTLRKNQEWYEIIDKIRIGAIDFLYVGYDYDLNRCRVYLQNLANMLDNTERSLRGMAAQF